VSQQQREALEQLLRDAPLDLGGEVAEQRIIFEEMMAAIPVPADVTTSSATLGGIPVVNVEAADADTEWVIFYLHGGAYALTDRGKALLPALQQITLWAQEHLVEDPT
jgi:acetyl esterase/lipase